MSQLLKISPPVAALALGLVIALTAVPSHGQRLYKQVDADGNVYYTDVPLPKDKDLPRETLNEQGIVVERLERAKTEAELLAEMEAAQAEAAEQARLLAEQINDRRVLTTYASEKDIVGTRDQRLEVIGRAVEAARAYIDGRTRNLSGLMERAAQMESRGHNVSDALRSSIDEIRRQISEQENFIKSKEVERDEINIYYNSELERYREVIDRRNQGRAAANR